MSVKNTLFILVLLLNFQTAFAQDPTFEQGLRDVVTEATNEEWKMNLNSVMIVGVLCLPEDQIGEVLSFWERFSLEGLKAKVWGDFQKLPQELTDFIEKLAGISKLQDQQAIEQTLAEMVDPLVYLMDICMQMPSIHANYRSYTMGGRQCTLPEGQQLPNNFFENMKTQCVEMEISLLSFGIDLVEEKLQKMLQVNPLGNTL